MTKNKQVKIEMDSDTARSVLDALVSETRYFTKDPVTIPERVARIRSVISDIESQV